MKTYIFVKLILGYLCFSEISELLLKYNADVHVVTSSGDTCVHGAVYGNQHQAISRLVGLGEIISLTILLYLLQKQMSRFESNM